MKLVVPPKSNVVANLDSTSDIDALAASQGRTLNNMVESSNAQMSTHIAMINSVASDVDAVDNRLVNVETPLKDSLGIFPTTHTNSPGGLVQLSSDGKLPVADGSNLINVSSSATERFSLAAVNEVNTTYSPSLGSTYLLHSNNSMTISFGSLSSVQVLAGDFGVTVAADNRSSDSNGSGQIFIFDRPMYVHYSVHLNWISTGTPDSSFLYIDVSYDGGVNWEARHSSGSSRKYLDDSGFTADGWVSIDAGVEHISRNGTVFFEAGYAIRVRVGYIDNEATFDSVRLSLFEV